MAKLYCLASGSRGNCYILEDDNGKQLLLDVGIKIKEITQHPAFTSWRNVCGALITHEHSDHALSVVEIARNGVDRFGYHNMVKNRLIQINNWKIKTFECYHDVFNVGFIIKDLTTDKTLVYATDTGKIPPIVNVDTWLIECNFDTETFDEQAIKDTADYSYLSRVWESHLGLDYLQSYFRKKAIKKAEKIIACHLSENNALPDRVLKGLKRYANFVDIADKGKEWEL